MPLKLFLWGGLKILLWLKFDRVFLFFVTNLLKISKQKMIKCAQNHFVEVSMLVQYIYKVARWIILKELEYIRVKIRFKTLNKLTLKCRNFYVKKEKIGPLFFKKWSNGASNQGIPLFNPNNLQLIRFSLHNY